MSKAGYYGVMTGTQRSAADIAADEDIARDVTSLTPDQAFELADLIETVMGYPANSGRSWTASELAKKIRLSVGEQGHGNLVYVQPETCWVGQVLQYLVRHEYVKCDDRGAWTRYWK